MSLKSSLFSFFALFSLSAHALAAGELEGVKLIYSKGIPSDVAIISASLSGGDCELNVLKEGRELVALLEGCTLKEGKKSFKNVGFIKRLELYQSTGGVKVVASSEIPLSIRERKGRESLILMVEPKEEELSIKVEKRKNGELLLISPLSKRPRVEREGEVLKIYINEKVKPPKETGLNSELVKSLSVKELEGEGLLLELFLSPEVAVIESDYSNGRLAVNLFVSAKDAPKGGEGAPKLALHFSNADVVAVIRAIARVANINVVIDPEVKGVVNIDFKKPVGWLEALRAVVEPLNLALKKEGSYYRIAPKEKLLKEKELEKVETYIVKLDWTKAKEVAQELKESIKTSKRESIIADEGTNSLILRLTPSHYREVLRIVKELDKPLKQVLVKAKIVQISNKAEKEFGFTWFMSALSREGSQIASSYGFNSSDGYLPLFSPETQDALTVPINESTLAVGILNRSQSVRVELALKALEIEGGAQVISSPKVLTLDNQEATIEQGIEIPYTETTIGSGGATSYNISFKKASLILKVKPHITEEGKIILDLEVRKDSPNYDYVMITGDREPAINTRNVKSRVIVENGSTVVIGGIYEKESSKSESRVPVISRIPLLGWLFKSSSITTSTSELLIFITPILVDHSGKEYGGLSPR